MGEGLSSVVGYSPSTMTAVDNHLEIGCGRGDFGPRFYAPCVTTDTSWSPGISVVCDAHRLALRAGSFSTVVVCNPYGYGFKRAAGARLMSELLTVLRPGGTLVVIGNSLNPFCQADRIREIAQSLSTATVPLEVDVEHFVASVRFPSHSFRTVDGTLTVPNVEIRVRMIRP